ncbi:MAG: aldo/keto reductase [Bryobacteraceae bacterium]
MSNFNRRDFLKTVAGAASSVAVGGSVMGAGLSTALAKPAKHAKRLATDWVPLGNSGVKVTRLAFGTGTFGGKVQRELGQEQFTRLVRYAYDQGIRFFETAQNYAGMHDMLRIALDGIPRDSYRLMTKYRLQQTDDPLTVLDRYRKELNSEYFDILLLHCVRTADWAEKFKPARDAFDEAKAKKIILAHGASCHGLVPIRTFPSQSWLDVSLNRVNNAGVRMDNLKGTEDGEGDVTEVVGHLKEIHARGTGTIGMKIMGEGAFKTPEQRDASIKFVMNLGTVDAVTIGYKSTAEIDEAIARVNTHLNS